MLRTQQTTSVVCAKCHGLRYYPLPGDRGFHPRRILCECVRRPHEMGPVVINTESYEKFFKHRPSGVSSWIFRWSGEGSPMVLHGHWEKVKWKAVAYAKRYGIAEMHVSTWL